MAKKAKKTDVDAEETDEKGGSKVKTLGIGVVLLLLGVFLGSKVLGGSGTASASPEATTTTTEPPGTVTTLDEITLNLADGNHFLKVGLAIETAHGAEYPHAAGGAGGGHGGGDATTDPTKGFTREVDAAIDILGSYSFEQLLAPGGKEEAKAVLLDEFRHLSHEAIEDLYFYVFVMQ